MKSSVVFVYSLMLFFSIPALALDSKSCATQSAELPLTERKAFLESCLAQVSSPSNVKEIELQRKKAVCEQNAKNYKLQDNEKDNYLVTCVNKNEAAAAVAAQKVPTATEEKAKNDQAIDQQKSAKIALAQDHATAEPKHKAKLKHKAKPKKKSKPKSTAKPKDASDAKAKITK